MICKVLSCGVEVLSCGVECCGGLVGVVE